MIYTKEIEAKNIKKIEVCPHEEWIEIEIEGEKGTCSLLNTGISYLKIFYLDYYKNEKIFNLKTRQIQDSIYD